MFPACELFLETIPCFNDTPNVIVTMSTPAGEVIHSFHVIFGAMTELSLFSINKAKYEGLIIRSNEDISVYIHNISGDSMIVFPIDAFARDYEIPRLTTSNNNGNRNKSTRKNYHDGALYIFSPLNNTSITIIQLYDSTDSLLNPTSSMSSVSASVSSSSFSSTTVKLDAFEIYEYQIDTFRRYRLLSKDVFAVILVQTAGPYYDNGSLCVNARLSLLDFVPPYSVKGRYFYLAFPGVTDFTIFAMGLPNTSLDITTDLASTEIVIDQSGNNFIEIRKTSSAWITASYPVSIYIKLTLCSNSSSPTSKMCAENGFFLPSVEHYFVCEGNLSRHGCVCMCPSIFERDINPHTFHLFRNESRTRPTTIYPILVGELFDVTTSIITSIEFKDADDIIVTTNTSFLVFRYDMDNLNFLPGGTTLTSVYKICSPDAYHILLNPCDNSISNEDTKYNNKKEIYVSEINECSCEFLQDSAMFSVISSEGDMRYKISGSDGMNVREDGVVDGFPWVEEDDTARPLIAVVVSLCVSIFAVIALISGYMLVEIMSRRNHVRNTKIRPFVS